VFESGDPAGTWLEPRSGPCCWSAVEGQRHIVFHKSITLPNREVAVEPKRRKLEWVERPNFQGWICTECAWVFKSSWPLVGKSIDEMKKKFEQERDKGFAAHVCAEYPRVTRNPG
jgi:hypothetical protein